MYLSEILIKKINFKKSRKIIKLIILPVLFTCFFLYACSGHKVTYEKDKYIIVIDPGHGGHDSGEVASESKIAEKDINLMKAKTLMHHINENPHLSAILTRNNDDYLALEERTAFANVNNADILISLHTSFIKNQKNQKIEIYGLGVSNEEKTIKFAVKENHTTEKNMNDLNKILKELIVQSTSEESFKFAEYLEQYIIQSIRADEYNEIDYIRIKKAPLYVLIGTKMTAVLIESPYFTGITKGEEDYFLSEWENICKGIIGGINSYIQNETSQPLALVY